MYQRRIVSLALILCSLCSLSYLAVAQDETDALRYSYLSVGGTARSIGFGNALGSVGGDFSSLSVNPAGIGIYRSSDIVITPVVRFNNSSSSYLGTSLDEHNARVNFNAFGAVFTKAQKGKRYDKSRWKTFSFGVGFNRVADFNRDYAYRGLNQGPSSSSASEVFAIDANMNGTANMEGTPGYLGYQSYLLDLDSVTGMYYTNVPWEAGVNQQRIVKERGGMNELAFSFGGNYREKLMLGFTVGVPSIRYTREADYSETDATDYTPLFSSFTLSESLTTTGIGINAKLGFIYKPADNFRFGAAIHSPTAIALTDVYQQSIVANTYAGSVVVHNPENQFNYSLTTPWRAVASATALFGKIGFFTADYEYVNYAASRFRFRTDDISLKQSYEEYEHQINQAIKNAYVAASNIKAGVEIRLQPLMLRAGFGFYGSPYRNYSGANRLDISGGIGFRFEHVYLDLGYVHSAYELREQPYVLPTTGDYANVIVPTARMKNNANNIAMTIGFRF